MSPKFQSISLPAVFKLHLMTRKWHPIEYYELKVPHTFSTNTASSEFQDSRFRVTSHCGKSAPNDAKWPCRLRGQRYRIYVLLVTPEPQISLSFPASPFHVTAHFETSAPNDPLLKGHRTLWGQRYLIYVLLVPPEYIIYTIFVLLVSLSPNFQSVSLYKTFLSYKPFWRKCTEWPQNGIEPFKIEGAPYVLLISTNPKFYSVLLYYQPFLSFRPFWDKCTE